MPKTTVTELSPRQLREAVKLSERIEALRQKLHVILGGKGKAPNARAAKIAPAKRRGNPAPAKAKAESKAAPRKTQGITPAGRAKLAAAMKARWAARKKGAPAPNASTR